jgi:hypothetical protein
MLLLHGTARALGPKTASAEKGCSPFVRRCLFDVAHGGTIFLDEVDCLPILEGRLSDPAMTFRREDIYGPDAR